MVRSQHIKGPVSKHGSDLHYIPKFIKPSEKVEILSYLSGLYPIWENRFSEHNPPPAGQSQRQLLRPVYWLGNWQFACLGYYHPPKGLLHRCVKAEPYPSVLAQVVNRIERFVRQEFSQKDIPKDWKLNTCLINFYGSRMDAGKRVDAGRVGEHKDFEPGPIGSISFGDRALIQFVRSRGRGFTSDVTNQQWLEDSALQVFGGERFKSQLFHRVQRVEDKCKANFQLHTTEFITRRLNLTFRFVPEEHIQPLKNLPKNLQADVAAYVQELAQQSPYWQQEFSDTMSTTAARGPRSPAF